MRKLGPHVQFANTLTAKGWNWIRHANIVKSVDYVEPLLAARPDAIKIFRANVEYQETISPVSMLAIIIDRLKGYNSHNLYIEGLNEYKAKTEYGLADYITWTTEFVRLAHIADYKVVAFSFPTGTPECSDWMMIKHANYCNADALGIHEYFGALLFTGWNALRYRTVHMWLGDSHPPFIITEFGRDALEGFEGPPPRPGWKLQGVTAVVYLDELLTYTEEVEKDDYVIGVLGYTIAPSEPKWQAFDLDDLADQLSLATTPSTLLVIEGVKVMTMSEATQQAMIEMEARQNAIITEAMKAILVGNLWDGASSLAGQLVAMTGKTLAELGITNPKA